MECKVFLDSSREYLLARFNRYIVECKVPLSILRKASFKSRFNRYIVECKDQCSNHWHRGTDCDLIDTLWNVKLPACQTLKQLDIDLIDTLWNVKIYNTSLCISCAWFNRYIVECKAPRWITYRQGAVDLIDTLWNVKSLWCLQSPQSRHDLIDTLWNVKVPDP